VLFRSTTIDTYTETKKYVSKYAKELEYMYYLIINGPQFFKDYVTPDSNFVIAKQIKKQVLDIYKDFTFWHNIIDDRIQVIFKEYINDSENIPIYKEVVNFYKEVILLIYDDNITRLEFEIKRLALIDSVSEYDLKGDTILNLFFMLNMTTLAVMMDIYTITRILKKPDGVPGFFAMHYAGDAHIRNIRDILVKYFGYTIQGEAYDNDNRCQDVSDIKFNLVKAKSEYAQ
jgi:hypothetical protein